MLPIPHKSCESVLVLGGSGFIGSHLFQHLINAGAFASVQTAGSGVSKLYRPNQPRPVSGVVDRALLDQCLEPGMVFWAIGGASVAGSIHNSEADYERSIPPLEALLSKMAQDWQKSRLVFLSSAAIYGLSGSCATKTDSSLLPISPYGQHKLISEQLILASHAHREGRCTIVRPFSVYGPGLNRQLFWDALGKVRRNNFDFFGSGQELRDWVYVGDLVKLLTDIAIFPERFPKILNAGSGHGISVEATLNILFQTLKLAENPVFAGLAKAGDPDRLVADAEDQSEFSSYFVTPLETGLRHYVDWYTGIPKP